MLVQGFLHTILYHGKIHSFKHKDDYLLRILHYNESLY